LERVRVNENKNYDLADHFLACAKLGRYLTVASDDRFVITDDFKKEGVIHEAAAVAAIYSKDPLVGIAALLPLSGSMRKLETADRDKYERLFHLIVEQTLSDDVKQSADALLESRFRQSEIRALEAELGGRVNPARLRYREFLGVVNRLMEGQISAKPFIEEFNAFTIEVAGRLDFGIYSFGLDSIFKSMRVSETVKRLMVLELLKFPPLLRREIISNILSYPGQTIDFVRFVETMVERHLDPDQTIQIDLLKDLKLRRFSMEAISALAAKSHGAAVH
jgi:hypothetical protein